MELSKNLKKLKERKSLIYEKLSEVKHATAKSWTAADVAYQGGD